MKQKRKYLISVIFFVILLILTFYLLFKNNDISQVFASLKNISYEYVAIGALLIFIYLFTQSIYMKVILKSLNHKIHLWQGFVYSCVEFYFSAITPSSTGGQPVQAYYMSKDDIPLTKSTVTLLLNTITFKLVLIFMGLIATLFYPSLIFSNSILFTIIFIFGIVVNVLVIFACLMLMYSKTWVKSIAVFCINVGAKLHIIKNKDKKLDSFYNHLSEYQESAKYIHEHPFVTIKVCLITFIQRLAMFSIAYIVYKAFGLTVYSYIELVVIQIALALAIDSLPLPGGIGASEAMMLLIYNKTFGENIAMPAMLVTRGLGYYFCLITSGVVVLINHLRITFKKTHLHEITKEENK